VTPGIFPFVPFDTAKHGDRTMMKTPVGLVTIGLSLAILLAATLLIATGTHGENRDPAARLQSSAGK